MIRLYLFAAKHAAAGGFFHRVSTLAPSSQLLCRGTLTGGTMVTASIDKQGYTGHILLQPNLSLSWQSNKTIIWVIALFSLAVGAYFTHRGFWLVMPFSGFHVLFFALAIYIFFCRNSRREVVRFTDDKVVIERGRKYPEKRYEYQRHWSQIYIRDAGNNNIPKVCIRSHGRELELGSFLGYDEKLLFIDTLKNITTAFRASAVFNPRIE